MPDRSVVVRLRAEIAGFRQGMDEATRSTRRTRDELVDAETAAGRLVQSANANREAWTTAGAVLAAAGGTMAAGIGLAVKTFADFDAQMSQVKTLAHANAREMDSLSKAALTMGQSIGFSASEVADAETELVKAGLSVKEIMGGALKGALDLAAAGQINVAQATEIAASAMTQFKLSGKDVPHVADLLAAGADKALGGVGELGEALKSAGTVSAQFGWSLDETVGTLAQFAQNAQIGERGGTQLRQMLLQLVNPSKQAQQIMDQYGFSITDANGEMVHSSELAGRLQQSFGDLTPAVKNHALAVLFGSHAIQGANILMSDGADVNAHWVESVNDVGFATQQAAGKMDNLKGDLSKLKAAIESDLIQAGSVANGTLRQMVQNVTGVAHAYGALPEPVQGAALGLGAVASAGLLAAGGFLLLLPRALETIAAFKKLNEISPALVGRLKGVAGAATAGAAAYVVLTQAANALYDSMGPAATSVDQMTKNLLNLSDGGLDKINASFAEIQRGAGMITSYGVENLADAAHKLADPGLLDRLNDFGGEMLSFGSSQGSSERTKVIEQINSMGDALGQLVSNGQADVAARQFQALLAEWEKGGGTAATLMQWMPAYSDALAAADNQQQLATDSAGPLSDGVIRVGSAAHEASLDVKGFNDALKALFDQTFGVEEATDAWHSALNNLKDAVKENGRSTRGNTDAAIANREALRASAQKAYDLVQAYADTGASAEKVTAKSAALKAEFIKQAEKAGFSKTAAEKYASALDEIPGTYKANLKAVDGITPAVNTAKASLRSIAGKQATVELNYRITTSGSSPYGASAAGIGVRTLPGVGVRRAFGGFVSGPGGPRDDAVPAMLSDGEFVVNAAATARNRPLLEHLNAERFRDGGYVQHFAKGGSVKHPVDPLVGLRSQYGRYLDTDIVGALIGAPDAVVSEAVQRINTAFDKVNALTEKLAKSHKKTAANLERDAASAERAMSKLADQRDTLVDRLKDATDRLADLQRQYDDYAGQVASRASGKGSLDQLFFGRDENGDEFMNSWQQVADALAKTAADTKAFQEQIDALSKAGLSQSLIEQIVGSDDGAAMAKAILDGGSAAVTQLNANADALAKASQELGKRAADSLYGAGVQAGQGLVDGLASQQKAIEAQMVRIAEGIQKAIRKALDMHSPSRKLFALGAQAGGSVGLGLGASVRGVEAHASRLAVAMVPAGRVAAMSPAGAVRAPAAVGGFPSVLEVRDVDGALVGRMRVEAGSVVSGTLADLQRQQVQRR